MIYQPAEKRQCYNKLQIRSTKFKYQMFPKKIVFSIANLEFLSFLPAGRQGNLFGD
jgi:hypothetical protein